MNGGGYFALLLERARPSAPALRRRQPALFERAGFEGAAVETVAAAVPRAAVAHDPPTAPVANAPVPTLEASVMTAAPRAPALGPSLHAEPTFAREDGTAPAPAPQPEAPRRRDAQPALPMPRIETSQPAAEPARAVTLTVSNTIVEATRAAPRASAIEPQAEPRSSVTQATATTSTPPPIASRCAAFTEPSRTTLRAAALAASHAPLPTPTPSEPPIQVTIGRIEVRAVAPPSPAARPQPRNAPRLGLEQYLRERNGSAR